jgi:cytochrome c oxidase subunit 2
MVTVVLMLLMMLPSWRPLTFAQVESSTSISPHRIEVTAKRFSFDPATITVKKGEPVVLVLKSVDVPHGLRIRELNIDLKASKGSMVETRFTPQTVGEFVGQCSVFCGPGHGSMKLTLDVVE